jgi:RNA polymerase sigma factor (sigma-70 family)
VEAAAHVSDDIEGLYRSERRSLIQLAWLILGSREAAEDAVQECFARMGARSWEGIENLGAYVRTMVLNECRSVIRKRDRIRPTADIPADIHLDVYIGEFKDALDGLTPKRRMVVVLRYYCDLPVGEIAAVMQCRPSTVSSLLHRAMIDLKEVLQ